MIRNYVLTGLRNLRRQPFYTFINVLGLALGLTCCFIIVSYIMTELSYDRYHEHADNVYRVAASGNMQGDAIDVPLTMSPLGPTLKKDFPEVVSYTRFTLPTEGRLFAYEDKKFIEPGFFFTDSTVFDIFSFPLVLGNPETALRDPYTVVINEEVSQKFFGNENPIGKPLRFNDLYDMTVTGVMEKVPENSHFRPRILASISTMYDLNPQYMNIWFGLNYYNYIRLEENADPDALEQKLPAFLEKYMGKQQQQLGLELELYLQPLTSIYLHSGLEGDIAPMGDISYIYIFGSIALFILLIAGINFMNLSTARSANRAKEVGLRKVLGAFKSNLIRQFLGESVILCLMAFVVSLAFIPLFIPVFNAISGKTLTVAYFTQIKVLVSLLAITLFVAACSGSYPAFYLSRFQPVRVMRGSLKAGSKNSLLRSVLVILQFAVSITLVIGTGIVSNQLSYMRDKNLGFDKEQMLLVPIRNNEIRKNYETVKQELLSVSGVSGITAMSDIPGYALSADAYVPEGNQTDQSRIVRYISTDHDILDVMNIDIVEGRSFSHEFETDAESAILISETAARELGWEGQAVGRTFKKIVDLSLKKWKELTVVGVFKDFHHRPLHEPIGSLFMFINPDEFNTFIVRVAPGNIAGTIGLLRQQWEKIDPAHPFEYSFFDDRLDQLYRSEQRLGVLFRAFSFLAIFIACLGLFGLASFTAEQRTKEIGIRKILGASVPGIVLMLWREFIILVALANIIAWPISFYFMNKWLNNFAFRTDLDLLVFAAAAAAAIVIALGTVSYQALRAAMTNPVKALRHE